jgi:NAD(P)-dependent dehydrogenase (short-subunit alcohol dehydrogenase family)
MQVAIITGAGSGIGLATARHMAGMGMAIVGTGRDAERLKALDDVVPAERLHVIPSNVTDEAAPAQIVQGALDRFGRVDFLINNAGDGRPKPLLEVSDDEFDYFIDVLLRAPFRLSREVIPHMKEGGAIINITSTFAVVGGLRGGAYSAAKAGVHGLTSHVAAQYGAQGIRCNAVAPGVVLTQLTEDRLKDPVFRRMNVEMTPHTRLGNVDDIAATVAFLCSEGGSWINGQMIAVDGGWSSTKYLSELGRTSKWVEAGAGE